jgi:putative ABC transport system permease protein
MHGVWQDLRFGARVLRRAPGFTFAAAAVLAIGIRANSAIFSLVDAVLLRPLAFSHSEELVRMYEAAPAYKWNRVSPLNFLDWTEQQRSFASMAAIATTNRALIGSDGAAESIPGQSVTWQYFDVLRIRPLLGRTFVREDDKPANQIVVLGEKMWRSRFGADPHLIGKTIALDSRPFTVIGVVPAGIELLFPGEYWIPFPLVRSPELRRQHYLSVIARLKPGVTQEQARGDMAGVAAGIARISPETNKGWGVNIEPLRESLIGKDLQSTSLALAGIAGLVLLMACANVGNLMLARGAARSREIAVRASLGGSRGRIMRQLVTESVLLSAIGGALGIALAWAIVRAAPSTLPQGTLPVGIAMQLDPRVIGFAAMLTLVTGVIFGFAPAWPTLGASLGNALRSGGRSATQNAGAFRSVLAAAEVAVAVVLVAGAGLLVRTIVSMYRVDPGFRAENVLTGRVILPLSRYPTQERAFQFYQAAERELAAIPGVRSAAFGGSLPLQGRDIGMGFHVVGDAPTDEAKLASTAYQMVSPNYFDALGIRLLAGRVFTDHDNAASEPVCIVNEEFAKRYLKSRNPIGARVSISSMSQDGKPVVREVIGVIRQVKSDGVAEAEETVETYIPLAQNAWYSASMEEIASSSVAQPRFRAELVGTFAGLAMALAAVGIFGVLAFSVSQRTREFGVRMALGARTVDVIRLVVGAGLRIAVFGVIAGVAGAAMLTRTLQSLLFEVKPLDPVTFVAAPLVLALIALAASALPALRASRVDPAIALRQE